MRAWGLTEKMLRLIPTLLRPRLLAIKNRTRSNYSLRGQFGRDLVITLFSAAILYAIYYGTHSALINIQALSKLAYLHASLPLALIFSLLFVMLLFSNAVAAAGSFFQSRDLDMILASPVSPRAFFTGRFLDTFLSSSWMVLVFAVPVIVAFGNAYHGSIDYYLFCLASLLPYFAIATALSVIIVTALAGLTSAANIKHLLLLGCLILLLACYYGLRVMSADGHGLGDVNKALQIVAYFSKAQRSWLPSYWSAICLGEILEPSRRPLWPYLLMSYGTACATISLAYITTLLFHRRAYCQAGGAGQVLLLGSRFSYHLTGKVLFFANRQYRGIIVKELRSFSRDMTQALQLLLLLGLCMIYLFNFKLLSSVQTLPDNMRIWWQGFLVFSSVGMGAFAITAIASRFVFPSVSLEGKSFWIIQSAPISIRDFLYAKLWCWFVPVAALAAFLFASGALAIGAPLKIVAVNVMTSFVICYGIVGLAVGIGAQFSNFDWESASQLSASLGNMIFMIFSAILIIVSLAPVGTMIFLRTTLSAGRSFNPFEWYGAVCASTLFLIYSNYLAAAWAIKSGEKAIRARMK